MKKILVDESVLKQAEDMKDTGGPAFPTSAHTWHYEGMTLRDYFAAKAMQGLLAGEYNVPDVFAEWAYKYADALLAERNKNNYESRT